MKILYGKKTETTDKLAKEIPIGTVFSGKILYTGVYLKTYDEIVDLKKPSNTWDFPLDEPHGASLQNEGPIIHNYKELNAEVVIHED